MESRDIYNFTKRKLEWENDWIHIGTGQGLKEKKLRSYIEELFPTSKTLMLRRGRRDSKLIEKETATGSLKDLIGKANFEIWSMEFDAAIKFEKIGVILKGKKLTK